MGNYFEEKKTEWGKGRWGKFTGSVIQDILQKGNGTTFGKGAMTRINKVACEACTSYEPNDFEGSWAMREGRRKEPEAAKFYSHIISGIKVQDQQLRIKYFGDIDPYFKPYGEHAGVSSDMVLFLKENPYIVAEFKCPTRDVHFERLLILKEYKDDQRYLFLKEKEKEYYAQIQFNMMCWGVSMGHWISYNEYFPMEQRAIIIEVPQDKPFQNNLDLTLKMAIREKLRIIELLKS